MRALLLLLLLLPAAGAQPLVVAVVPDLPGAAAGDEAVAVADRLGAAVDLSGYSLSDGEGSWSFPAGARLAAGETAWIVGNETAWGTFDGPAPRWSWAGTPNLRLANDGDEVRLLRAGRVVDEMRYGDKAGPPMTSYASPGLVYQRLRGEAQQAATWVDSDGSADWVTPRLHRVGESTIPARSFATDATLYASPDHSYRVLSGLLDGATRRVVLHVYDLRHQALVDHLEASARRGVSVDVLVHGSPIGQDEAERFETAHALQRVESAGGRAWLAGSGRYSFHHLKVLVVDDHVAIQSENWVPSGVPQDPSWGNRGWGIVLHSAEAAAWFANWMAEDRAAWDTERFDLASYAPFYREPPRFFPHRDAYRPRAAPALISAMQVDVVVSPEHTNDPARDPVAAVASTATQRLWVEQMDLRSHASNRLGFRAEDPLYGAILASGASDKRVLAATPFRADDLGNREVLGLLAAAGVAVGELERAGIVALHNKGLIADDAVVIGSMNGNHASRSQNREVAVIVHSAEAAEFYAALFADDWRHLVAVGATQESPWPMLFLPLALAALLRRSRA